MVLWLLGVVVVWLGVCVACRLVVASVLWLLGGVVWVIGDCVLVWLCGRVVARMCGVWLCCGVCYVIIP